MPTTILSGALPAGSQLKIEPELQEQYGTSRNIVRGALRHLTCASTSRSPGTCTPSNEASAVMTPPPASMSGRPTCSTTVPSHTLWSACAFCLHRPRSRVTCGSSRVRWCCVGAGWATPTVRPWPSRTPGSPRRPGRRTVERFAPLLAKRPVVMTGGIVRVLITVFPGHRLKLRYRLTV